MDSKEKSSGYFIVFVILAFIWYSDPWRSKHNKASTYDRGYENAWDDEEPSNSPFTSQDEKDGYEQGLDDSWMYDEDWADGNDRKKPKHPENSFYMDGYKDGKSY